MWAIMTFFWLSGLFWLFFDFCTFLNFLQKMYWSSTLNTIQGLYEQENSAIVDSRHLVLQNMCVKTSQSWDQAQSGCVLSNRLYSHGQANSVNFLVEFSCLPQLSRVTIIGVNRHFMISVWDLHRPISPKVTLNPCHDPVTLGPHIPLEAPLQLHQQTNPSLYRAYTDLYIVTDSTESISKVTFSLLCL